MLATADLLAVLDQVEAHQRASESASSNADIAPRAAFRQAFHRMLRDDAVSIDALKAFFDAQAGIDTAFMNAAFFGAAEIAFCREQLRTTPCVFTAFEPPVTMWIILRALKPLLENIENLPPHARLVIATDCSYRPHAQVTCHADGLLYEIRLGSFLLDSLIGLALVTDDLTSSIRTAHPGTDFVTAMAPDRLLPALQRSVHRYQLPYFLVSIYEGEKYRFGLRLSATEQDPARFSRAFTLATLMACFVLAHELSHILLGHLDDDDGRPARAPLYRLLLDPDSEFRSPALEAIDAGLLLRYQRDHLATHDLEFNADLLGARLTMNCAVDLTRSAMPGAAAVGMVLAAIALFDRMHAVTLSGVDPAMRIGVPRYNAGPFAADVLLPMPSHPWGKTRASVVTFGLMLLDMETMDRRTFEATRTVMHGVNQLLAVVAPEAMAIMRTVIERPGEWLAFLDGHGLYTKYYPRHASEPHAEAAFYWNPADLYGAAQYLSVEGGLHASFPMPAWPPADGQDP